MANANSTSSRTSKRTAGHDQLDKPEASPVGSASITPSEQRLLRIFAAVPEHSHRSFFSLMETICYGCNWKVDSTSALQPVSSGAAKVIDASARFGAMPRIDVIPLFGSQKLSRVGDGKTWLFSSATTTPEPCTERESMFINAALHAAGGQ